MDFSTFQEPTIEESSHLSHKIHEICGGLLSCEAKKVWLYDKKYLCSFNNYGKCIQKWKCNYGIITNIYEVIFATTSYLAVICSRNSHNDILVLINTSSFAVIKSVYFCEQISSVCTLDSSMSSNAVLNKFTGILVVGCYGGRVYLLNLKLDNLFIVHQPLQAVKVKKFEDCLPMEHEAIEILEEHVNQDQFIYQQMSFSKNQVYVSSVSCFKQLNSLAIGYSFGCFVIFNIIKLKLLYSSPCSQKLLSPVNQIIYMEPENDPKSFVYLWVVRGQTSSMKQKVLENKLTLYQLIFGEKNFYTQSFEGFQDCNPKLDYFLCDSFYSSNSLSSTSSFLLHSFSVPKKKIKCDLNTTSECFDKEADYSLACFSWIANNNLCFGIFDLNMWYQAQMPNTVSFKLQLNELKCSFFSFYKLKTTNPVIDFQVFAFSHFSFVAPVPENFLYPSSSKFCAITLFSNTLCRSTFFGTPRHSMYNVSDLSSCDQFTFVNCFNVQVESFINAENTTKEMLHIFLKSNFISSNALQYIKISFQENLVFNWLLETISSIEMELFELGIFFDLKKIYFYLEKFKFITKLFSIFLHLQEFKDKIHLMHQFKLVLNFFEFFALYDLNHLSSILSNECNEVTSSIFKELGICNLPISNSTFFETLYNLKEDFKKHIFILSYLFEVRDGIDLQSIYCKKFGCKKYCYELQYLWKISDLDGGFDLLPDSCLHSQLLSRCLSLKLLSICFDFKTIIQSILCKRGRLGYSLMNFCNATGTVNILLDFFTSLVNHDIKSFFFITYNEAEKKLIESFLRSSELCYSSYLLLFYLNDAEVFDISVLEKDCDSNFVSLVQSYFHLINTFVSGKNIERFKFSFNSSVFFKKFFSATIGAVFPSFYHNQSDSTYMRVSTEPHQTAHTPHIHNSLDCSGSTLSFLKHFHHFRDQVVDFSDVSQGTPSSIIKKKKENSQHKSISVDGESSVIESPVVCSGSFQSPLKSPSEFIVSSSTFTDDLDLESDANTISQTVESVSSFSPSSTCNKSGIQVFLPQDTTPLFSPPLTRLAAKRSQGTACAGVNNSSLVSLLTPPVFIGKKQSEQRKPKIEETGRGVRRSARLLKGKK